MTSNYVHYVLFQYLSSGLLLQLVGRDGTEATPQDDVTECIISHLQPRSAFEKRAAIGVFDGSVRESPRKCRMKDAKRTQSLVEAYQDNKRVNLVSIA
jgi:hypothetical protein